MNTQFHAERLTGLGGSDLGAVLGLSPYRTPYEVWLEKTGRAEPFDGNLATRFGTHAEQFVAEEYCRETGRKVQRYNDMLRHPQAPLLGHVDRLVVPDGALRASYRKEIRTNRGLEAKTAGIHAAAKASGWGEPGTDEVPEPYLIQCAVYMALTGCEYWDLAVLIGGNADFRIYNLKRDADLEDMVLTEADRWWQAHVVSDTPPDPSTELEARQRWARHRPGKVVTLPPLAIGGLQSLAKVKADMAALKKLEQALRDELIPDFEDADELRDADSNLLGTYRANKATCKTDWKAVAEDALAEFDEDLRNTIIADHTTLKPGARVLRLAKTLEAEA